MTAPETNTREDAIWRNLLRRLFTQGGAQVAVAVALGAASKAIAFERREPDTGYGVLVTPSWPTTVSVAAADKSATGFTVHFGTVAPANATVSFLTFRKG